METREGAALLIEIAGEGVLPGVATQVQSGARAGVARAARAATDATAGDPRPRAKHTCLIY